MNTGVTVIMPVYNAAPFVREAVQSILDQTLKEFRLLIIDDCSTDESPAIITSFNDPRILYHRHQANLGVVAAMNTGLEFSETIYTAVMHADDIALPDRLSTQKAWLDEHQDTAVIAGTIIFINDKNDRTGVWTLDQEKITREEIRSTMPWENCIAHPSVMMRTEVIKKYGYDPGQQLTGYAVEDYPLWLSLLSDGHHIDKLLQPVLLYRSHDESATSRFLRRKNPFLINYATKKTYIRARRKAGKLNKFDLLIIISLRFDYVKAGLKTVKWRLKRLLHV